MNVRNILEEANTQMEQLCNLRYDGVSTNKMMTTVICTIGRSTQNLDFILKMIRAGMTMFRINLAYDTQEFHKQTVVLIQEATHIVTKEKGYIVNVGIMADVKGPEIRTGLIDFNNEIELKRGDNIRLSTNRDFYDKGTKDIIYVDYPNIINVAVTGTPVYIAEGRIKLVIKELTVDCLICEIIDGGTLGSKKNVILPGIAIDLPTVSERDRHDLKFAMMNNCDIILAAGVRSPKAIKDIRALLGERGKSMKVIARVENLQILQQIQELVQVADGIVFSRNELGIEVPNEKLFLVQKAIFSLCNKMGKPVFGAAHLLESMRYNQVPTRSEVFDLGNMVLDGADGIMLSSETAIGDYPEEAALALIKICHEAEAAIWYKQLNQEVLSMNFAAIDASHAVALGAVAAAKKAIAAAIVVLTSSGKSAYLLSRYRPRCPIIGITRCGRTARQMRLHRGILPVLYKQPLINDWTKEQESRLHYALICGHHMGIVHSGDPITVVTSWKDNPGFSNNMRTVYAYFEDHDVTCAIKIETEAAHESSMTKNHAGNNRKFVGSRQESTIN